MVLHSAVWHLGEYVTKRTLWEFEMLLEIQYSFAYGGKIIEKIIE